MEITPRGDRSGALAAFGIRGGPFIGEEVPVRSPVARVGRAADNNIVIDDDSVSAQHARLEFDEGAWRLTDLGSTNGTYVEGVRLTPDVPTPLHYGVSLRIGGIPLHFRAVESADPAMARTTYTEPKREPTIRERKGFRFPVWLLVVILLLIAVAVLLFTTYRPLRASPSAPAPAWSALPPAPSTGP